MEMSGSQQIAASPEAVWAAITDPQVLKDCIPGCSEMTGTVEDGFEAVVTQKIGPVKATFRGKVQLRDVRPGEGCRIEGEGKAGPAGYAKGAADVTLVPEDGGTRLDYAVNAQVGGKLAQLGGRLIDGVAKSLADRFFDGFRERVEAGAEASAPAAEPADAAAPAAAEPKPKKGFFKRLFA
ncbi:carbon monoxide dehydrogenase [Rhodobacterales bacterium HKCCE2091]|nr:carbon monoxide dehydrogenase [Rhodobacterales bacterium HKCCE2091]